MFEMTFSSTGDSVATTTTGVLLVEQRDRPVLHLPGGVGVGGDVGDLLELQRALQRHRQADVAAEVEEEVGARGRVGDRARRLVGAVLEQLGDQVRQALELGDRRRERARARASPRSSASRSAIRYIAATWLTNVLVAATPISRPARV